MRSEPAELLLVIVTEFLDLLCKQSDALFCLAKNFLLTSHNKMNWRSDLRHVSISATLYNLSHAVVCTASTDSGLDSRWGKVAVKR